MFDMRKRPGTILGVVALAAAVGGGAYAAIPASDGSVRACYATSSSLLGGLLGIPYTKGDTRVVDEGEACRSYEKPLSWSQRGPAGPQGVQGIQGPQGLKGDPGASGGLLLAANRDSDQIQPSQASTPVFRILSPGS
jgi:hypothetical protein